MLVSLSLIILLSLCYICQGFYGVPHHKTLSISSYTVAGGFILSSLGIAFGLHNIFLAVPFGLIGALLFVQTGRIRFVFDTDSMEVCYVDKSSPDGIQQSRENFAVGGRNRWTYKSFKDWYFVPSKDFPVLMYFSETQTKPEGQFHLFPVIMNGRVLYDKMMERVGSLTPDPSAAV